MTESAQDQIANEITWKWGLRHDLLVGKLLVEGENPDFVHGLSASTVVDRLFCWLGFMGVMKKLWSLKGKGIQREGLPFGTYVLLYFLRCLARLPSQNSLPAHLFSDVGLMEKAGFNAHDIAFGMTRRGDSKREGLRENLPLDPEAMSENIVKLDLEEVRAFFRDTLKLVWAGSPFVPKKLMVVVDGTFIEVGPTAKGAGVTSRTKQVRTREGMKSVTETIIGFKMVWMWVPALGLPLAVAFTTAETDEREFVEGLLRDAQEVLGKRGQIDTILVDRGYIAGPAMWALAKDGIRFIVPARHDMKIYEEAVEAAKQNGAGLTIHRQSRTRTRTIRTKEGVKEVSRSMEVVGVEGARTWETYAAKEDVDENGHRDRNKKGFEPNHLNAVVLTHDDDRDECDFVLLTNGSVQRPFTVYDDYDERSPIENQGHREMKQRWFLENPVQRNAKAAELHVLFVVLSYTLTQAFRLWEEAQLTKIADERPSTLGKYIRKLEAENRDRVIVFIEDQYGIYYTSELLLLLGRKVKHPHPRAAKTLEDLMERLERAAVPL
jgi:hypothetical protein